MCTCRCQCTRIHASSSGSWWGEGVPVQGTLLRTFHGSASFYQGHGSCVSDSIQDEGTTSSLPGRLVASGILTRAGSPCSEDSAPTLQAPRDCCQLGEVSGDSDSADGISGSHPGLTAFRVFILLPGRV